MEEKWTRWEPASNLAQKYYIHSISDTIDGFFIKLFEENNKKKKIKITFEDSVNSYRNTNESYRLKTIDHLDTYNADKRCWTFFKVNNSSYLQWFLEESYGIYDDFPFIHFSFVGVESILDVIAKYEPKIELINK